MDIIIVLSHISIVVKLTTAQFAPYGNPYFSQPNMPQPYFPQQFQPPMLQDEDLEYEDEPQPRAHKRKYGSSGGRGYRVTEDYDEDYDAPRIPRVQPPNQQNLVLVPYPYALVVPNMPTPSPKTTTTTTVMATTEKTTTQKTIIESNKTRRNAPQNDNTRYMMTAVRRTKPTWMPKYGIVPIPDHLAEKLMSQLREIKGLKARRRYTF